MHAAEEGLRDALHLELFSDGSALLVRMRPGGWRVLRSEARDPSESASACSSSSSRTLQVAVHFSRVNGDTGTIWHQTAMLRQRKVRTAWASHLQVLHSK